MTASTISPAPVLFEVRTLHTVGNWHRAGTYATRAEAETAGPEALLTASPVNLWFRPRRGEPWELVARCASDREAWGLIGTNPRRHGEWIALPAGQKP